jgi:hypothetical protein
MRRGSSDTFHLPDWKTLTPVQRDRLIRELARKAHADRAGAICRTARSALARLIARLTPAFASAGTPASVRRPQRPRSAPRGREF